MLRRMKADVNMSLPPMRELLVRVEMSATQKKFYRDILASKFPVLAGSQGRSSKALLNVVDELRKVCNHPYLFPGAEPLIADQAEAFQASRWSCHGVARTHGPQRRGTARSCGATNVLHPSPCRRRCCARPASCLCCTRCA